MINISLANGYISKPPGPGALLRWYSNEFKKQVDYMRNLHRDYILHKFEDIIPYIAEVL